MIVLEKNWYREELPVPGTAGQNKKVDFWASYYI